MDVWGPILSACATWVWVLEDLFPQGYSSCIVKLTIILHTIEPTMDSARNKQCKAWLSNSSLFSMCSFCIHVYNPKSLALTLIRYITYGQCLYVNCLLNEGWMCTKYCRAGVTHFYDEALGSDWRIVVQFLVGAACLARFWVPPHHIISAYGSCFSSIVLADHILASSNKVRNVLSYTSTPPHVLVWWFINWAQGRH